MAVNVNHYKMVACNGPQYVRMIFAADVPMACVTTQIALMLIVTSALISLHVVRKCYATMNLAVLEIQRHVAGLSVDTAIRTIVIKWVDQNSVVGIGNTIPVYQKTGMVAR